MKTWTKTKVLEYFGSFEQAIAFYLRDIELKEKELKEFNSMMANGGVFEYKAILMTVNNRGLSEHFTKFQEGIVTILTDQINTVRSDIKTLELLRDERDLDAGLDYMEPFHP